MTNKQKLPGLFGTALIAVLVLAGCPNPGGGGDDPHQPGGDALEGTWSRNSPTLGSLTLGFDGYGGLHMIIGTVGSASGSYVYNHPHLSIFLEGHPEAAKNGIVESVSSSTLILSGFTGNESDLNGTWQKKQSPGGGQQYTEGVYIGLISFAGTSTDLTGGAPILLNNSGRQNLNDMLRDQYTISSQSGTALFYGVHQALANLKANETRYPANLQSVNVITFTDGLDNGSTGQAALRPIESQSPEMTAAYAAYVQQQIANRTIAGKSITAYSVGVMGSDVTDTAGFQTALTQIASRTQNANQLDDFSEVEETFETIAGGLNIVTTSAVFNMTTPTGDSGTKVRITFDNVQPANPADIQADTAAVNASTKWIQGTRIRTGTGASTTYTLTDITYSAGITSGAGSGPITGFLDEQGVEVAFTFRNVVGLPEDLQASQVKQWFQPSGVTTWQINSEYFMGNAVTSTVEKKSSIIYLVLDSSRSLSTEQIAAIRAAAGSFIGSLYEQLNPED